MKNHNLAELKIATKLITHVSSYNNWLYLCKRHYDLLTEEYELEYRPYQYEYAAMYCSRDFNICAGSQGIGKTFIAGLAIAAIYNSLVNKRPGTVQIIVPNELSGKTRWLEDLNKIKALRGNCTFVKSETELLKAKESVWIYTQDFLRRNSRLLKGYRYTSISYLLKHLGLLPSFVVVDEIHNLKENTLRTQHIKTVLNKAKRRLALSGTITDDRLALLHHCCDLIYGHYFPMSKRAFVKEFSVAKQVETNYLTGAVENERAGKRYLEGLAAHKIPTYYSLIKRFIHRVTLETPEIKACTKYPNSITTVHEIDPSIPHLNEYKALITKHIEALTNAGLYGNDVYIHKVFSLLNPLELCSSCTKQLNKKAVLLKQLCSEALTKREKVCIFVNHVQTGRELCEELKREIPEANTVRLYAVDELARPTALSSDARAEVVDEFMYNPECLIGVFSLRLASESINLTSAKHVIFYELSWSSIQIEQAISRAVRPGSKHSEVNIHYLLNKGMIDVHMYSLFAGKVGARGELLDLNITESKLQYPNNAIDVVKLILEEHKEEKDHNA
jgi:SNF2 family DNA or RNA helicase